MVDLKEAERLLNKYKGKPFGLVPGAFAYQTKTPAHDFKAYLLVLPGNEWCVAVSCRDFIDDNLAAAVLKFVVANRLALDATRALAILEGFECGNYAFDCVGILSPVAAKRFAAESKALSRCTFLAFPMYRCEFSGDEDGATVDMIRHDIVPTLDWARSPSPVVKMQFLNTRTGVQSISDQLSREPINFLLHQCSEMADAPGSFIKLLNFRGEKCEITADTEGFLIEYAGDRTLRPYRQVREWLASYLCPADGRPPCND